MVELKSSTAENEDEGFSEMTAKVAGQVPNAHDRGIVGIFPFRASSSRGSTGIITVAHDSAKIWRMDETDGRSVNIVEKHVLGEWRVATQSCDATPDGKNILILGIDGILKEIVLSEEGPQMLKHDFGYAEAVHIRIFNGGKNYLTTSFSGNLTEIDTSGKVSRQTPLQNAKHASCIACSPNNQYIAVAMTEGAVNIFHGESFTHQNTFEVHSMKIRTVTFTLDNANFLTGSDDKTIKMHSLHPSADKPASVLRTYCGNRDAVTCIVIDERSNGYRFASSNMAAQIYLWHLEMATPIQTVPSVHTSPINALVFTPRGRHLLSVGDDKQIVCYAIPTSEDAQSSREPTPEPEPEIEDADLEPEPGQMLYEERVGDMEMTEENAIDQFAEQGTDSFGLEGKLPERAAGEREGAEERVQTFDSPNEGEAAAMHIADTEMSYQSYQEPSMNATHNDLHYSQLQMSNVTGELQIDEGSYMEGDGERGDRGRRDERDDADQTGDWQRYEGQQQNSINYNSYENQENQPDLDDADILE